MSLSDPASSGVPAALPARTRRSPVRTISALMLREMATRYGASPGGYAWAVVEPLGTLFVLALAFSLLLRNPSLGESFILFYATAFLPFNVFNGISNAMMQAMMFSKALLKYPAVSWIDTLIARFLQQNTLARSQSDQTAGRLDHPRTLNLRSHQKDVTGCGSA